MRTGCAAALLAALLALSPAATAQERRLRDEADVRAALLGMVRDSGGRGIPGALVLLRRAGEADKRATNADGEGLFRLRGLPPGIYELMICREGFGKQTRPAVKLTIGSTTILQFTLERLANDQAAPPERFIPPAAVEAEKPGPPDRDLLERKETPPGEPAPPLPPEASVFSGVASRWELVEEGWKRYTASGEYPYVKGRPLDPFNRNRLKGDYPLFGRTFVNFLLTGDTFVNGRRLPIPSPPSSAGPGRAPFFGRGEQLFTTQVFRFTADVFHGDTAFRPFDWRARITPAVGLNYLRTRENGIVNIDVRRGTDRFDAHAGLQEAFIETKLLDLSPNYDFLSLRAGIQPFSSDFRGFVFVDEQPGARLFGNFFNNRWEYNLAYFYLLEKDTNSVLNTFQPRGQQVAVANLYVQDFFVKGYTTQFSVHLSRDDAAQHFDTNDFLVRPAPIGLALPHTIRTAYLGWTGNGHFGRININHAFYQALGEDERNLLAGRAVTVNAQMAAAELSLDKDWLRIRSSVFYASGDADPRDGRGRGFDSILDAPQFVGGPFSFWNGQGIRLTGTGVALVSPNSLLPSLRANKEEGQANFVNPGLWLVNLGTDVELTPKLRAIVNVNYLRFVRTEPLELLLFQAPIRHGIGLDYSLGVQYRPPLSDNLIITFGASALTPHRGFRDLYTGRTLFSLFANVRLQY
jgi:hypothetical protein